MRCLALIFVVYSSIVVNKLGNRKKKFVLCWGCKKRARTHITDWQQRSKELLLRRKERERALYSEGTCTRGPKETRPGRVYYIPPRDIYFLHTHTHTCGGI